MSSVLVDVGEYRSEVVRHIKEAGCSAIRQRLDVGDYAAGAFLFERKTAADLLASLLDGRLFDQAGRMRGTGLRPVLVVEGDLWGELAGRDLHPNSVMGALLALASMGISLVPTPGPQETGALVCLAARRAGGSVRVPTSRKGRSVEEIQMALLTALPGVGPRRAAELLRRYGSPLKALQSYRSWGLEPREVALLRRILEGEQGEGA